MQLIERYIYDVTRRLPEAEREEATRKLTGSINDMLPDNPTEQDINAALTQLGAPSKLAGQYGIKPRYLISPALYDSYITVLKSVTIAVACVCACIGVFAAATALQPGATAIEIIGFIIAEMLTSAFWGAVMAVFWVTIGFVIAERSGYNIPPLPGRGDATIPHTSALTGMALAVIFTAIYVFSIYNGWLFGGRVFIRGTEVVSPISQAALERSIPFVIALACVSLIVSALKLIYGRWSIPVCAADIFYNIVWAGIAIYIILWPDLINADFTLFISRTTESAVLAEKIANGGALFVPVAITLVCVFAVINICKSVWKTVKGMRNRTFNTAV
jgi:hypothetical protein